MRPDGKVVVDARPRHIDLPPDLLVGLGDEHRIAFRRRVVHDAPAVGRPVELGDAFQVGPKRAAHRRNRPPGIDQAAAGGIRHATPEGDQRPVWRKANSAGRGIPQLQHTAFGEVVDVAGPDLADPGVPRAITVGEKSDELPVARNGGVMLRSLEIRQPRELRAFQRIPPEVLRALQLPCRRAADDQQTRSRRGPPGASAGRAAASGDQDSHARQPPPRPRKHRRQRLLDFEARVADVAQTALRILLETALEQSSDAHRRLRGQGAPVGLAFEDRRRWCRRPSRRETPAGPSTSRTTRSRTPRCRSACRPPSHVPARDSCRRPCPQSPLLVFPRG